MALLEICIDSLESALAAQRGGADRLELCSVLGLGGLTPSAGLVLEVQQTTGLPGMMMLRPRSGNFVYQPSEKQVMERELAWAAHNGLQGVVVGALLPDNKPDLAWIQRLRDLAPALEITFHRAFDLVDEPLRTLEDLIAIGVNRVLSSGQAGSAWDGMELLQKMVKQAAGRIAILPGAGVRPENVAALREATGATEFHGSAAELHVEPYPQNVLPGSAIEAGWKHYVTLEESVKAMKSALG